MSEEPEIAARWKTLMQLVKKRTGQWFNYSFQRTKPRNRNVQNSPQASRLRLLIFKGQLLNLIQIEVNRNHKRKNCSK